MKNVSLKSFSKLAGVVALVATLSAPASAQQTFQSPELAAESLAAALRAGDQKALVALLGPGSDDVISSGDAVDDDNVRKAFLLAYDLKHSVQTKDGKTATLLIGRDDYPFSIPIARKGDTWNFDVAAGREELFARRVGRNELAAIQTCLAYVEAQHEYAAMTVVDKLSVYAQRLVSTPGMKNGLYWPTSGSEQRSPLGPAVALATLAGYRVGSGQPYNGYLFKILTRQGAKASGGEHDYVVNGKMIGGFALIAWPAQYGNSGIATFLVNHDGDVFEKDLGEATGKLAPAVTSFNPDDSWTKVKVEN